MTKAPDCRSDCVGASPGSTLGGRRCQRGPIGARTVRALAPPCDRGEPRAGAWTEEGSSWETGGGSATPSTALPGACRCSSSRACRAPGCWRAVHERRSCCVGRLHGAGIVEPGRVEPDAPRRVRCSERWSEHHRPATARSSLVLRARAAGDRWRRSVPAGNAGSCRGGAAERRPLGFDPADVIVGGQLWHGEDDPTVPVEAARALAAALPRYRATVLPGAGHLWHFDHVDTVLSALGNGVVPGRARC